MNGHPEIIDDPGELASVRSQATSVGRSALIIAAVAAALVLLLP